LERRGGEREKCNSSVPHFSEKVGDISSWKETKGERKKTWRILREKFREKQTWILALFIFFVAFSPSFGAPFFYYSVDTLKFSPIFLGAAGSIAAAASAIGAILFGKLSARYRMRPIIRNLLVFFALFTLVDLVYFLPYVVEHSIFARYLYGVTAGIGGFMGAFVFLAILNSAALAAPRGGEGTVFATLTAFWNVGLMGASALGGYLFGLVGLQPLIIVSSLFTALALFFLPRLRFVDDKESAVSFASKTVAGASVSQTGFPPSPACTGRRE
jgi:predicted MFS family arabinose efflux permease